MGRGVGRGGSGSKAGARQAAAAGQVQGSRLCYCIKQNVKAKGAGGCGPVMQATHAFSCLAAYVP